MVSASEGIGVKRSSENESRDDIENTLMVSESGEFIESTSRLPDELRSKNPGFECGIGMS